MSYTPEQYEEAFWRATEAQDTPAMESLLDLYVVAHPDRGARFVETMRVAVVTEQERRRGS